MTVVNLRFEKCDVRIDRQTRWGNPFIMGRHGDRDAVCEQYKIWLWKEIKAGRVTLEELAALKDKKLGCHCAPLRCHGHTLSAAALWAFEQIRARNAA